MDLFGFKLGSEKKDTTGLDLVKGGKHNEAIAYYTERFKKNKNDLEALIQLGVINFLKDQHSKTKEWLLRAVERPLTDEETTQILEITNYRKLSSEKYLNSFPAFSADGKWVAFTSTRRDTNKDKKIGISDRPGLYALNIETNQEILVSSDNFYNAQPSFSPDGQRMVFLSARRDINQDGIIDNKEMMGVYLKDLSTGAEECLVQPEHRAKFPAFSPDGNSVIFCGWHYTEKAGIFVLDLKTRATRIIQGKFECNFPSFAPKGDKVLYSSWRKDTNFDGRVDLRDNSGLYLANARTGDEVELMNEKYSNSYATFSPDGENVLYLSRRRDTNNDGAINSLDNSGIYLYNVARQKDRLLVSDENFNKFPAFAQNGKKVVFISSLHEDHKKKKTEARDTEHSEYFDNKGLYCVDSDGKNIREIVSPTYYGCRFLAAAPKGDCVAFVAWRKDTNRGLYLARLDRLPNKAELRDIVVNCFPDAF